MYPNSNIKSYGFSNRQQDVNSNRFLAIYFLDKLSGSLLLSKEYSLSPNSAIDMDLIGGFLNALNLFIKEVKPGDKSEEIQEINFDETRILYERYGRLLVIAITRKTSLNIERSILKQIVHDFYSRFEGSINHFDGRIEPSILKYKKRLEITNLNTNFKHDFGF
ncbi:MAG: hypothetical protein ACTSV5_09775 [Promethearchaeota archaeon]